MKPKNIQHIYDAYQANLLAMALVYPFAEHDRTTVAAIATVIDYLRGDIKRFKPKNTDPILARALEALGVSHPPEDANTDPNPIGTEVMRQLGSLGVQNLKDIKGWKLDTQKHFLLYINNRFADTGWIEGDPHIKVLSDTLASCGLSIEEMQ